MAVVIKNIKFPACCYQCKIKKTFEANDMSCFYTEYQCGITGEHLTMYARGLFDWKHERSSKCPLIEVDM